MAEHLTEPDTDSLLPTRQSLLSRLRDWQDQAGWRQFFDTYWRLIYSVARKAGLNDAEAQDVVQNTFIYLTRRMPRFQYDRTRGSFKSWLRVVTRSRIQVYCRREKARNESIREPLSDDLNEDADLSETWPDQVAEGLDEVWQREWEQNLVNTAFRRLRTKVSSQQLLIFRLTTVEELPLAQVAKKLNVSLPQVYLARHRVGKLFKSEVERLRRETE
jgi:RNA polymerase sigma-70 factor (ECF subfamily)